MTLKFSGKISKKSSQILKFTKILPVAVELFYAERRRDRGTDRHDEANCRF